MGLSKPDPSEAEFLEAMKRAVENSRIPVIIKPLKVVKAADEPVQQLASKRLKKRKSARAQVARVRWNSR